MVVAARDARSLNAWRRWGYRFLPGDLYSYLLHMRPAEWPIMAAHTVLGYILAVGVRGAGNREQLGNALLALVIWVVFLNGGTLAINSVFDKDEGDIGYLNAPPPLPRYLLHFSVALLVIGQLLAFALPRGFQIAYAICFVLSILYSVPPFRFKAVAGVDWVINMWGFGTLTPYAAWAATGRPLDVGHGLVLLAFCPLFAGLYPLTQLYQFEEDRRRGDRNPERRRAPHAAARCEKQDRVANHEACEDAVVRARQRLQREGGAEQQAAPGGRIVGEPVQRQHRERHAAGHQQLNVRAMGVEVGTEREHDRGDD